MKAAGAASGPVAPDPASDNSFWWDPTQGKLFFRFNDGNSVQWVEAVATPDLGPDDFVSVDVDQVFTETEKKTARSNIYAAPFDALSYNGMQINGSMDVSQQFGSTPTSSSSTYPVDNWFFFKVTSAAVSAGQYSWSIPGFSNALVLVVTTGAAMAAGDVIEVFQNIEGYRVSRLNWGTAYAQPITIGFWTQHDRPGIYGGSVRNGVGNRTYAFTYTQNVAATSEYKTVTIPGDTTGTWSKDNTAGMTVVFVMACGTNHIASSANTWTTSGVTAPGQINGAAAATDRFRITGVVVVPGIEAPSAERAGFIMRPYDQEFRMCQRYLQAPNTAGNYCIAGYAASAILARVGVPFKVQMRATPTLIIQSVAGMTVNGIFGNPAVGSIALVIAAAGGAGLDLSISGATPGQGVVAGFPAGSILFDARL